MPTSSAEFDVGQEFRLAVNDVQEGSRRNVDEWLVSRARAGDGLAFDQLTLKYQTRLIKLAQRYTQNYADAEDAVQDALIKAFGGLRCFRGECTFYTWLYRVTINSARNVLRLRRRSPLIQASVPPNGDVAAEHLPYLQELDTPENLSIADEVSDAINAALAVLPESHRTAILLREVEGLPYEKIAAAMAIPIGTVRSRISRAREAIDVYCARYLMRA